MLIACAQGAAVPAEPARNLEAVRGLAAEAAGRGAAVLVLPELYLSGYLPPDEIRGFAVALDGPEIAHAAESARRSRVALCLGFAERAPDGRLFDSAAFFDADGRVVSVYRKAHLFGGEASWATAGGAAVAFDAGGVPAGMWICYDTRFPELARLYALDGAVLGLVPAAWMGPAEEWELALRARAMDNGIWVVGAPLCGQARGFAFRGSALVADPHGRVVARGRDGADELVVAECDEAMVSEFRGRLPLLSDRRVDLYGAVADRRRG